MKRIVWLLENLPGSCGLGHAEVTRANRNIVLGSRAWIVANLWKLSVVDCEEFMAALELTNHAQAAQS